MKSISIASVSLCKSISLLHHVRTKLYTLNASHCIKAMRTACIALGIAAKLSAPLHRRSSYKHRMP